ncbi:adenylyltransferase/cytidyltransferase family protein [Patescibacteria group bacterium]|nr:adenylyltransferase/cytidyltransferase family protein [Patescibacteria group bacterium]MBU1705797.1 adenylyltransferase/cytidyltransferase family protein [Patescibacteria group bacterium]
MSEEKKKCLFVGRFQPFHNGHLMVVSGMAKVCNQVIIAIGSANAEKSLKNPFTVEQRREMIQRALQSQDLIPKYDISFIEVDDKESDYDWTNQVLELAGDDVAQVWTGDEWTKKCFQEKEIEVKDIKEVPGISATQVRQLMIEDGDWHLKVPPEVADYLDTIGGVARVKSLA